MLQGFLSRTLDERPLLAVACILLITLSAIWLAYIDSKDGANDSNTANVDLNNGLDTAVNPW